MQDEEDEVNKIAYKRSKGVKAIKMYLINGKKEKGHAGSLGEITGEMKKNNMVVKKVVNGQEIERKNDYINLQFLSKEVKQFQNILNTLTQRRPDAGVDTHFEGRDAIHVSSERN